MLIRVDNDGVSCMTEAEGLARQSHGIGLRNVGERLEKLYPDDHAFEVRQGSEGKYQVTMNLPLRTISVSTHGLAEAA